MYLERGLVRETLRLHVVECGDGAFSCDLVVITWDGTVVETKVPLTQRSYDSSAALCTFPSPFIFMKLLTDLHCMGHGA